MPSTSCQRSTKTTKLLPRVPVRTLTPVKFLARLKAFERTELPCWVPADDLPRGGNIIVLTPRPHAAGPRKSVKPTSTVAVGSQAATSATPVVAIEAEEKALSQVVSEEVKLTPPAQALNGVEWIDVDDVEVSPPNECAGSGSSVRIFSQRSASVKEITPNPKKAGRKRGRDIEYYFSRR